MYRLLITDGTGSAVGRPDVSAGEWDVLPVGIDAQTLERRHRARLARLGTYRVLDTSKWADRAARDVREYAVPLLHGLPERPAPRGGRLGDILRMSEANCWWFLEISEKSPLRGALIQELYALAMIRCAVGEAQYDAVWLETANPRLAAVLRTGIGLPRIVERPDALRGLRVLYAREWLYWIQAARHLLLLCLVRTVAWFGQWPASVAQSAVLFFTMYPNWWLGADTPEASDRFFPDLPDAHGGAPFAYAAWINGGAGRLWAHRRKLCTVMRRRSIVPLQGFVPLRAALGLLSPALFLRLRAFRRACLRSELPGFLHFDVSSLVAAEISRSIGAGELAMDRLLFAAVRQLVEVARPAALVFRAECQPSERAILYGAQGRTRTIGFWHSALALCDNYLPFHFPPGSLRREVDPGGAAPLPLPDAMLVSGAICERTLTQQGYPASRVTVCGPIRHRETLALIRRLPNRRELRAGLRLPANGTVLFAATSVVPSDARAMLWALAESAPAFNDGVVVVKVHPASGLPHAEIQALREAIGHNSFRLCTSHHQMYELMAASDAVVTGGSTLAFEAIALGVMPILFETPSAFSASSFVPFAHACFIATNAPQLRDAIEAILRQDRTTVGKRAQWGELIRGVFGDVAEDPGPRFLAALEAAVGNGALLDDTRIRGPLAPETHVAG